MEESGETSEQSHGVRYPRKFVESRRPKFQADSCSARANQAEKMQFIFAQKMRTNHFMKEYWEFSVVVTGGKIDEQSIKSQRICDMMT